MDEITVVIEKGIPIPTREYGTKGRTLSTKYEFLKKMTVGDSVELRLSHDKGAKHTRAHKGFTYYGLMNAIHKAQKENMSSGRNSFATPTIGYGNRNVLKSRTASTTSPMNKYSTRTIRVENKANGNGITRIVRVWRVR